jgi:tetratricopeptide (TPR) repeat protein
MAVDLIVEGKNLARGCDIEGAVASFRKAREVDSTIDIEPEAEARRLVAEWLVLEGEQLVGRGKIKEAVAAYAEAQKLDSMLEISAGSWNNLCWLGSLWGYADDICHACEKAVALEPGNGNIRDSRGLARALTGNTQGAIEDFEAFISWTTDKQQKLQRRRWIRTLRTGKNPFTPRVIKKLLHE